MAGGRFPYAVWCGLALMLAAGCDRAAPEEAWDTDDPFAVRAVLSTNQITIGDPVELRVMTRHPTDTAVEWPVLADDDTVIVREQRPPERGARQSERRYMLTSFRLGEHLVYTGTVRFVTAAGDIEERPFPSISLEVVTSVVDEEAELSPIKPLMDWPGRVPRWLPVLLGIALLALLLGLLFAVWLRKRRTIVQQAPPPPAHETALNALALLKRKGYIEQGQIDPFYIELSAIVRRYLEDRFRLRAPESTTEEFIRDAASAQVLTTPQQDSVSRFLEQSDLVKFARFRPDADAMQDAFAAAERLIRETKLEAPGTTDMGGSA